MVFLKLQCKPPHYVSFQNHLQFYSILHKNSLPVDIFTPYTFVCVESRLIVGNKLDTIAISYVY